MKIIGIDPGKTGGISIIDDTTGRVQIIPLKDKKEWEIADAFGQIAIAPTDSFKALIERVNAMPKQGVTSTFNFGKVYGFLRGCLAMSKIPFEETTPARWVKYYQMARNKNESDPQWKRRLLARAKQLYPEAENLDIRTADSLLIAHYAKNEIWNFQRN